MEKLKMLLTTTKQLTWWISTGNKICIYTMYRSNNKKNRLGPIVYVTRSYIKLHAYTYTYTFYINTMCDMSEIINLFSLLQHQTYTHIHTFTHAHISSSFMMHSHHHSIPMFRTLHVETYTQFIKFPTRLLFSAKHTHAHTH